MKSYARIISLLKQDARFVSNEDELLKNIVLEAALKFDTELIKLLISDDTSKNLFFLSIGESLVFDKDKFTRYISNKEFLPDSYTSFKNKIGLINENGEFLSKTGEVVLAWPYKDCVLEGGQTKEDQKRDEVFWNEILAPDEIDSLLEPKVLTNFMMIDRGGEHSIEGLSSEENLIIKGNNLLVLHSLAKNLSGKVKLIYIDPPYNTDNDSFLYNDSFKKSTWLTFMKNRLEVGKKLLSNDGAIFVQISDVRLAHLKLIMDEIFGPENFINQISIKTKSPSGFKTVNLGVFETAEYLLVYGKNKKLWKYKTQYVPSEYDENYKFEVENIDDQPNKWRIVNIEEILAKAEGFTTAKEAKKKLGKGVFLEKLASYAIENAKKVFRFTEINDDAGKETLDVKRTSLTSPKQVFVVERVDKDNRYVYEGNEIYFYHKKLRQIDGELVPTNLLTNIWTDISYEGIANEGGVKLKKGKKPEKLIRRVIEMSTDEGDLVLDYHLGSGTTCAVAHKLGRRYIGIEQLNYGENDSLVRLNNVINGDKTGISKYVNWQGGGSFISCELLQLNQRFIDAILNATSTDQLLDVWNQEKVSGQISYKVDIKNIDSNTQEFSQLSFENQKRFLLEVLEKNQLYVNLSEIDDEDYHISETDKQLNQEFYNRGRNA